MHQHTYVTQRLGDGRWETIVTLSGRVTRFYADSEDEAARRADLYIRFKNYRRTQWQPRKR